MEIHSQDALLIVDMQRDFCPGGALPVREEERLVPILNLWMAAFVPPHPVLPDDACDKTASVSNLPSNSKPRALLPLPSAPAGGG